MKNNIELPQISWSNLWGACCRQGLDPAAVQKEVDGLYQMATGLPDSYAIQKTAAVSKLFAISRAISFETNITEVMT